MLILDEAKIKIKLSYGKLAIKNDCINNSDFKRRTFKKSKRKNRLCKQNNLFTT